MPEGFFEASTLAQVKAPLPTMPQCGACKLHEGCSSPKMPPSGHGQKEILIVAEAPGKEEDEQGTQLVGRSGKLLRKQLSKLGVNLDDDCWKTNALICRPPNNATPTEQQVGYCYPNLKKAVQLYKPKVIIPLGEASVKSTLLEDWDGKWDGITRWAGWQVPHHRYNAWVCPTYHPAFILRKDDNMAADVWWKHHLKQATQLKHRPWPDGPPDYKKRIEIIHDTKKAARIIRGMHERGGMVAFDYETNMLKPDGELAWIISCSICWQGKRTIAYLWQGDAIEATLELLWDRKIPKIASNMKFEDRWTRAKHGKRVLGWHWDTMLGAHGLDNRRRITSIKFQSFVRLGVATYDAHIKPYLAAPDARTANKIIHEIDTNDLLLYNGLDSLLEYDVAMQQMEEANYPSTKR